MNGGIAPLVMRKPLTAPVNAPMARQPTTPSCQGRSRLEVSIAPTTPESARIDPTERSMPAEQMTNVMPIASTPNTDVESRMLRKLEREKKALESAAIVPVNTARTMSDSKRNAAPPHDALAPGGGLCGGGSAGGHRRLRPSASALAQGEVAARHAAG